MPSNLVPALFRAVARGDLQVVQRVVAKRGRAVLATHSPDGCTPLLLACKKGHQHIVSFFLSNGCRISDRDHDPKRQGNALHYAAWGGHISLVRWLLTQGASLDDVDIVGNTPLLYAVYGGHRDVVEEFLRRGRSLREKNNKNHTVILQAACGGHLDLVRWLLDQGFSLSETDHDGNTALLFAAWGGHLQLMQFLLSRGASLHEKNHNGHSVFLSAANGGRVEIVEWLLLQGFSLTETNNNGDTALLLAAYGGHKHLVQRLLELGGSLADKNGCGFTPLLSAANGGQLEMAQWLLAQGSRLDEADNDGYTSLILAACGGNIELVKFFLLRGASLKERNHNGDTALLLAAYCGHRDLVEWLLDHGSSLDERNNTGMGVLISACNGGHLEVVQLLMDRLNGTGLEDTDEGGYTPLLLAAQRGHLAVVQFLAAHGANVQARTHRHNNDAISLAIDFPEVQEYLQVIWEFAPLQVAADARMLDRCHALIQSGLDASASAGFLGADPLTLARNTQQYRGAKPPCARIVALLSHALLPWSPARHSLFGQHQRRAVVIMTMVRNRLEATFALPLLPTELWLHIFSFLHRSWFVVDATQARGALAAAQARSRRRWRGRWLRCGAEEDGERDVSPAPEEAAEEDMVEMETDESLVSRMRRVMPERTVAMDVDEDVVAGFAKEAEGAASTTSAAASGQLHLPYRVTWV